MAASSAQGSYVRRRPAQKCACLAYTRLGRQAAAPVCWEVGRLLEGSRFAALAAPWVAHVCVQSDRMRIFSFFTAPLVMLARLGNCRAVVQQVCWRLQCVCGLLAHSVSHGRMDVLVASNEVHCSWVVCRWQQLCQVHGRQAVISWSIRRQHGVLTPCAAAGCQHSCRRPLWFLAAFTHLRPVQSSA